LLGAESDPPRYSPADLSLCLDVWRTRRPTPSRPRKGSLSGTCEAHLGAIDLVLTDVILPGEDGVAVTEGVLQRYPTARVVYMSGFTDDRLEKHGFDRTQVTLLSKPFTRSTLLRSVSEALQRSRDDDPPSDTGSGEAAD
jgi:CheY-like chemotaxis protein